MLPPPLDQSSHSVYSSQGQQPLTPLSSHTAGQQISSGNTKVNTATGRSSSNFHTVQPGHQIPPASAGAVKKDEATQSFLSSIPSRMRSLLTSIKEGFIEFGASIGRFFSSLMPNRNEAKETEKSQAPVSPHELKQAETAQFKSDIKNLSVEEKQKRMDAFVAFFKGEAVAGVGVFRLAPNYEEAKLMRTPFLATSFEGFKKAGSSVPQVEGAPIEGSSKEQINEIASLFKDFLGAVDLFEETEVGEDSPRKLLMQALGTSVNVDESGQIEMLQAAINQMKPENVKLLEGFLSICDKALKQVDTNQMTEKNLAIVFGPRLAPKDSSDLRYNKVAELLIKHRDNLDMEQELTLEKQGLTPEQRETYEAAFKEKIKVRTSPFSLEGKQTRMAAFDEFFSGKVLTKEISPGWVEYENLESLKEKYLSDDFTGFQGEVSKPGTGSIEGKVFLLFQSFINEVRFLQGENVRKLLESPSAKQLLSLDSTSPGIKEAQIKLLKQAVKEMKSEDAQLLKEFLSICKKFEDQKDKNQRGGAFSGLLNPYNFVQNNLADDHQELYGQVIKLLIQHQGEVF